MIYQDDSISSIAWSPAPISSCWSRCPFMSDWAFDPSLIYFSEWKSSASFRYLHTFALRRTWKFAHLVAFEQLFWSATAPSFRRVRLEQLEEPKFFSSAASSDISSSPSVDAIADLSTFLRGHRVISMGYVAPRMVRFECLKSAHVCGLQDRSRPGWNLSPDCRL